MTFEEVIGQADAEQRLLQLEREQRIPHAMLFCGPEGWLLTTVLQCLL